VTAALGSVIVAWTAGIQYGPDHRVRISAYLVTELPAGATFGAWQAPVKGSRQGLESSPRRAVSPSSLERAS
jgi:hypothetical protein